LAGIAVGYLGGKLIKLGERAESVTHAFRDLSVLSIGLLAFALAEMVYGNGFIAAFCAGLIMGNTVRDKCKCLYDFAETEGQLLTLLIFMVFGAVMVVPALHHMNFSTILYAILSLTVVRMLPAMISLKGMKLQRDTLVFLGWFGPRGVASILFALLVLEDSGVDVRHEIFTIVVLTVLLSIIAHGMTAVPGVKWYASRVGVEEKRPGMAEHDHATEMPTRLSWSDH